MASNPTVKLVADIEPALKTAFAKAATRAGLTIRAATEQALRDYIEKGKQ
jgi:hypothetical protein